MGHQSGFSSGGSGLFLMLRAAFLDCQFLDLFPFSQNGFVAAEVDVGGRDVVQVRLELRSMVPPNP